MLTVSCRYCGEEFKKDPRTGNFLCPTKGCGKGGGINVKTDKHGNVLFTVAPKEGFLE